MSKPAARGFQVSDPVPMITDDAPKVFRREGDGYVLDYPTLGISLHADRLRRESGQLVCELRVECQLAGARTVDGSNLSTADCNISSLQARQTRAKHLLERSRAADVDWVGVMEEFSQRVIEEDRAGAPAVLLREVPKPPPDDVIDINGWVLPARHPAMAFGDGGSGKSMLALYGAGWLAARGRRVLLCDWELSAPDHRVRLEALFPDMPPVRYLRCERPLTYITDQIVRTIRREQIDYVVFDSVAFACDGPPEAAEVAGRYFQAVRQCGPIGSLHIAHITKAGEHAELRPFGSTFWHNGARSTWFVKLADGTPGSSQITVGLYNRKANLGPLRPPVGFAIAFGAGRTQVQRANLADVADLAARLPIKARLHHLVKQLGSVSLDAAAEELDVKPDSIRRTIERAGNVFVLLKNPDGTRRIGLLERAS